MHPRLSVSTISSGALSLEEDVDLYRSLGVATVGLSLAKARARGYAATVAALRDVPWTVTSVCGVSLLTLADPAAWPAQQADLVEAARTAAALGASTLVVTTGAAGGLSWEQAADALCEVLAPVVEASAAAGVRLALEPTNALRLDVGFVQRFADAADLARDLGAGVCLELQACWMERGLDEAVRAAVDLVSVVQVSDYVVGSRCTPDRAVPGDGDMPLERLVGRILDAGYAGLFEIEILGPRVDAEGYGPAIARSVRWTGDLLDQLGC